MSSFSVKIRSIFWVFGLTLGFVFSNPTGENVTAGSASFDRSGNTLIILQSSDKLITNWQDFSIQSNELTKFIQPSSSSASLNRVISGNPSAILGNLEANGKVYLINPNGIVIGSGANINCNSFIASTLDVKDSEFLAGGAMTFSGSSTASIMNLGKITASGGDVFLMARQVQNQGEIHADQGNVGLGAGIEILLQESGNERMYVKAGETTNGTGVDQQGVISAIRTELKSAGSVYTLAINAGGMMNATQVEKIGGEVYLRAPGGKIKQTGTINAKGTTQGGKVVMEGSQIAVGGTIDVSGEKKAGNINIGGGFQGKDPTIQNAQQVKIAQGAVLKANGGDGNVVIWSDGATEFYGSLQGNGANAEISGKNNLTYDGAVDLGGTGKLLLDPQTLDINDAGAGTNRTLAADLDQFTDFTNETSFITTSQLLSLLSAANVTLQANTDITFSSSLNASSSTFLNKSLTVNAGRSITINSNIALTLNGGGFTATVNDVGAQAGQRTAGDALFSMNDGSSLTTNGGAVNVSAGSFGGSTKGGIVIGGGTTTATMSSGTGSITLTGAAPSTTNKNGVNLNKGTLTTTNGPIQINGTGVAATSSGIGVILQSSSQINSTGTGNISLSGTGGAGTSNNYGLHITTASQINSSGTGTITLNGTGGNGTTSGNDGVRVDSASSKVTSISGDITINGTGNGTVASTTERGVSIASSGLIQSTGSANILINGTGAATTTNNFGIQLTSATGVQSSGTGTITMNGTGGAGTGASNDGIRVDTSGAVSSVSGNITMNGTGNGTGGATTTNRGILISSTSVQSTGSANILMNGTGGAGLSGAFGIQISAAGATVQSSGTGTITMNGTGGLVSVDQGIGIQINTGIVTSSSGNITLTGTGNGAGGTTSNHGVKITSSGEIDSTGSANISITGTSKGTAVGLQMGNSGSNTIGGASSTGNITLMAETETGGDSITLTTLNLQTTGTVTLRSINDSTTIGVGTGSTGTFNLSVADLATIHSGTAGVVIGKTTGTGAVDLRTTTWSDGVTILSPGSGSQAVTINNTQTAGANKNLVIATGGTIVNNVGAGAMSVSGTGKWLIYAPNAASSGITLNGATPSASLNGLTSSYLYNGTYSTLPPGNITQTGNRFIFATPATLTFTANNASKNYGESNPTFTDSFTSGLLGSDTLANAFQGTLTGSSTASSVLSPILLSIGSGASDLNYKFNLLPGTLTTIFDVTKSPALLQNITKIEGNLPEAVMTSGVTSLNKLVDPKLDRAALQGQGVDGILAGDDYSSQYSGRIVSLDEMNSKDWDNFKNTREKKAEINETLLRWWDQLKE